MVSSNGNKVQILSFFFSFFLCVQDETCANKCVSRILEGS